MARGPHPAWQEETSGYSSNGGPPKRGRSPSRGLLLGGGAVILLIVFLTAVGVIAAQSPSGGVEPAPAQPTPVSPSVTPEREHAGDDEGEARIIAAVDAAGTSSAVESPRTVASSWSAGPTPVPPAPAPPVASEAERLAAEANATYGVRIVLEGQDWGDGEAAQAANVNAVISAISLMPDTVISAVVSHAHGPLTFVSNNQGRTLDGWQPYGSHPMAFYTNSDQGPAGSHASNQVVLSVGATSMSVGHEILHAYQARSVGPDEYVLALLQPEMRSFMEAVGWRQTGSDEEVRQAVNQPWSALDSLFVYEGHPLTYTTAGGATSTITAANPVEAFAITGSMYYSRPSWIPLPDWPEHWAWFRANLG
jgi:hypothetical protein